MTTDLSYVRNNPINFTDPTGHCEFDAMSIEDRVRWMQQFMAQSGATDWFNGMVLMVL